MLMIRTPTPLNDAHQGVYFCLEAIPKDMSQRTFAKPVLSTNELISFLQDKGLEFKHEQQAKRCLTYIGYYRLKIYMRPFETASKNFRPGTTFEKVVETYNFDRKLRLLCLDAIERVEVALRASLINVMGSHGGPHFYYEETFFENKEAVTRIRRKGENGKHLSITHYKTEYETPYLPAIWCLTEASTFGEISRWYADLHRAYRKEIASEFGFDESICVSWFRCLSTLRNICAHHGRLWNAEMRVDMPKKAKAYEEDLADNTTCYSRLVVLAAILKKIDPGNGEGWKSQLRELLDSRPTSLDPRFMGFPENWTSRQPWPDDHR